MARKKLLIRPRKLTISLPGDVADRLEDFLTNSSGKVPNGAYQDFFVQRIEDFFGHQTREGKDLFREIMEGEK